MRLRQAMLCSLFAILLLSFSGCGVVQLSPEELMRPPILTKEQTEIYNAAEAVIGSGVIFRYPNVNGVHSAFVMHDYDRDGEDEALVFYQTSGDENTRINILDKMDGRWRSVGDVEGAATNIDNLTFASMYEPGRVEMIAEWSNVSGSERILTVLTLENGRLETLFSNVFSSKAVFDIDRDGVEEILLLTGNGGARQSLAMLVEETGDGTLTVSSSCTMSPDTYEYVQLLKTATSSGEPALLVDGRVTGGAMISEMLTLSQGRIRNLIYSDDPQEDKTLETYRAYEVLSADIDYDGTAEIPALSLLPGPDSATVAMEPIYLQNWMKLTDGNFRTTLSAVVNEFYGYYLIFPDAWRDKVTVLTDRPNEWVFVEYSYGEESLELELGQELLRILVFAKSEYYDEFDTKGFEKIYENSKYEYFASLNYVGDGLQLSREELNEAFVPISS